MEKMNNLVDFGEEKALVLDGNSFPVVAKSLVQNELKYPYYWGEDEEISYETNMEDILDIVWNDPHRFSIEGLEDYYGVLERDLIEKIRKASLQDEASC